jgi:hypothetical protein
MKEIIYTLIVGYTMLFIYDTMTIIDAYSSTIEDEKMMADINRIYEADGYPVKLREQYQKHMGSERNISVYMTKSIALIVLVWALKLILYRIPPKPKNQTTLRESVQQQNPECVSCLETYHNQWSCRHCFRFTCFKCMEQWTHANPENPKCLMCSKRRPYVTTFEEQFIDLKHRLPESSKLDYEFTHQLLNRMYSTSVIEETLEDNPAIDVY